MNYKKTLFTLQSAINRHSEAKVLVTTNQWYSDKENKPVTVYHIKRRTLDKVKNKESVEEIFKTYSLIQAILFLRDYWYLENNWEPPTDNEMWNEVKSKWPSNKKEDAADQEKVSS